eukprot:940597-Amorphochlora_amoeboformis.AAC.3
MSSARMVSPISPRCGAPPANFLGENSDRDQVPSKRRDLGVTGADLPPGLLFRAWYTMPSADELSLAPRRRSGMAMPLCRDLRSILESRTSSLFRS